MPSILPLTHARGRFRRGLLKCAGAAALAAALVPRAAAQSYPDRPSKVTLGYSAGGTADTMLRLVAQQLSNEFGQPFVVENKPGASGNIAATQVARSTADGYSLLMGNTAEMAVNRYFMKNTGFDAEQDFAPVALIYDVPLALVVSSSSPYKTLDELIAAAKKPGSNITFASAGQGSPGHLAGEELARSMKAPTQITHIPYKGAAPALVDVIAGHVTYYFSGVTAITQFVKSGQVRVLALSSKERSRFMKDVPTVAELTGSDFSFTLWGGIFAPSKTDKRVVAALNEKIAKVMALPNIKQAMEREGSDVDPMSPDEFSAFLKRESSRYQQVVTTLGIKPE